VGSGKVNVMWAKLIAATNGFSNSRPTLQNKTPWSKKPLRPQGIYAYSSQNFTFGMLKENMPKALESVPLATIRQWEHQMYWWMEAYWSRLGTSAAQLQVRHFSSASIRVTEGFWRL